jgi:hypothetical protein
MVREKRDDLWGECTLASAHPSIDIAHSLRDLCAFGEIDR